MYQDDAKVGGLEPAATFHSDIVALADVVDVHRDTGISPWNAQHGSGYSSACPNRCSGLCTLVSSTCQRNPVFRTLPDIMEGASCHKLKLILLTGSRLLSPVWLPEAMMQKGSQDRAGLSLHCAGTAVNPRTAFTGVYFSFVVRRQRLRAVNRVRGHFLKPLNTTWPFLSMPSRCQGPASPKQSL